MATVRVELARVINLGDYETLKIGVTVQDDARNGENAEDAFNRVFDFVEEKLDEKVSVVEGK